MAYLSTAPRSFAYVITDTLTALFTASDRIVADRRHAVAVLEAKSDDDLARLGLRRGDIAQDVHRHLYYS